MTNKEIMETLYHNAETVWAEYHTGLSKSANVIYEGTEYVIFAEDKPILEEVQRRLEMSEWHTGTPTEEGDYIVLIDGKHFLWEVDDLETWNFEPVTAWQRIEEENND